MNNRNDFLETHITTTLSENVLSAVSIIFKICMFCDIELKSVLSHARIKHSGSAHYAL